MRLPGRADDPGVVAARGQCKRHRRAGGERNLVDGAPGRDVVFRGADREDRRADVAERDDPAIDGEAPGRKAVLQEQAVQVFAMHPIGHARLVGVPGHHVAHRLALAEPVFADALGPDEIVRAQRLERAGHLLGIEKTLRPHQIVERGELALVDEQHQFAGLREVRLRSEERHRRQSVVAVARHGGCGDGEDRAAQAIAAGVNLCAWGGGCNRVERRQNAEAAIIVEPEIAILRIRIAPGNHVDGEAALHEPADERVLRRQVQNVVFHDPGRRDQDRLGEDVLGLRREADQLHQPVAEDDLARRCGDVDAHLERLDASGRAIVDHAVDVVGEIGGAAHQIGAGFLDGAAQHRRIEHGVRARRHHVQGLMRQKSHLFRAPGR